MSKLDELIRELCPDGVGTQKNWRFCNVLSGTTREKQHTLNTGKMEQFRG